MALTGLLINYRPQNSLLNGFERDVDQLFWRIIRTVNNWSMKMD
jgi:hypothetical protein